MSIKCKTVRSETDLVDFMSDNNLSQSTVSTSVNSSGMAVIYYNDAAGLPEELWSGTDDGAITTQTGYADAITASQWTAASVSGLAGLETIKVVVDVADPGTATVLNIAPRWSNSSDPDEDTTTDWSREYEADRTSIPVTYTAVDYQVGIGTVGKYTIEIMAYGANCNLVLWGDNNTVDVSVSVIAEK